MPEFNSKKHINILEPSVGSGSFIPFLIDKYRNKNVTLDVIDIDGSIIALLSDLLTKIDIPKNIEINLIKSNFLDFEPGKKYDLIVANPPFGKIELGLRKKYKDYIKQSGSNNLYALFLNKAINIADYTCFITPKSLLNTPEFDQLRNNLRNLNLKVINDLGEKAFKGVLIETISILIKKEKKNNPLVKVRSFIDDSINFYDQLYIQDRELPCWLIYRNKKFDSILKSLTLDVFKSLRDREITKKHTTNKKLKIRVLKSRNISDNKVINIKDYDTYLRSGLTVKAIDQMNADKIIIPNLSYYPRAAYLPRNCICDGSIALLETKNGLVISKADLGYFATDEFKYYYSIARNKGTRSLNIDRNSIVFWGIKKNRQYNLLKREIR